MQPTFFFLAVLAATIAAETTELQLFNAGKTTIPLYAVEASVVDANAIATTLAIRCKEDGNTHCALYSPFTITQGPSTYTMSAVYTTRTGGASGAITLVQDCDIISSTQVASCSVSVGVEVSVLGQKTSTGTTTKTAFSSDEIWYTPVVVTAGVEKLTAPKATQTPVNEGVGRLGSGQIGLGQAAAAAVAAAAIRLL